MQPISDVGEESMEIPIISHRLRFLIQLIRIKREVIIVIVRQEIGEDLFTNHLIGNDQLRISSISSPIGNHPEMVGQADEIVRIHDRLRWEMRLDLTCDEPLLHQTLDDKLFLY